MIKRLYYILVQRLFVLRNRNNLNHGQIYMFHKINDDTDTYSISKNNFESFIKYLFEKKNIVDVETLIREKNKNNVVLTFDDAYKDVYDNAFPVLENYNVPYYLFICNEYLNKDNYLNEDMIKVMLEKSKCLVGSHNFKHELSRFLDEHQFEKNIIQSKKELEELFKINIDCFAFPYGSMYACSNKNIDIVKKHYKNIFMTYSLNYNESYNVLPRININDQTYKKEIK